MARASATALAIAVALIAGGARAESEQACNRYADEAVRAQKANLERPGCRLRGDMWSDHRGNHFTWCRGQPAHVVAAEQKRRMDELTRCTKAGQASGQNEKFCADYAQNAVRAQAANKQRPGCGKTGDMWSENYGGHFQWCLGQQRPVVEAERKRRMDALTECSQRPRFCDGYANRAVSQQNVNAATPTCRKQGPRWSSNKKHHYDWCLGQERHVVLAEEKARDAEVAECGFRAAPSSPGRFAGNRVTGLELAVETGGRLTTVAGNATFLSGASLCAALTEGGVRPRLNEAIKTLIRGEAGKHMPRGFGVRSDARHELSSNCAARAEIATAAGGSIRVNIKLMGNRFFFHVTTPPGVPGSLDPEFSTAYDLEVNATVLVPSSLRGAVGLGEVVAAVTNVQRLRGENVGGDIAVAADSVIRFLGGPDITRKMRENRLFTFPGVAANLAQINNRLRTSRYTTGARLEHRYDPGRDVLVLVVTRGAAAQPPALR